MERWENVVKQMDRRPNISLCLVTGGCTTPVKKKASVPLAALGAEPHEAEAVLSELWNAEFLTRDRSSTEVCTEWPTSLVSPGLLSKRYVCDWPSIFFCGQITYAVLTKRRLASHRRRCGKDTGGGQQPAHRRGLGPVGSLCGSAKTRRRAPHRVTRRDQPRRF